MLTGLFCHLALGMRLLEGLLCGAVLGSTDAASVFSILRARKLALKENTDSLLEVESGSNDPFAYMLTAVLLTAMESGITPGSVARLLAGQLLFGLAFGFGVGAAALWLLRRLHIGASGFDTIFVVAVALLSYAAPAALGGNGFLSVYITGILLGNGDIRNKATLVPFFDGVTSMMQMVLFFPAGTAVLPFPDAGRAGACRGHRAVFDLCRAACGRVFADGPVRRQHGAAAAGQFFGAARGGFHRVCGHDGHQPGLDR